MPYIERDGARIFYQAEGQGPAVLLSHGFSATSVMWKGQIASFRDRYRIITWDMRGHGESSSPEDPALYSTEATIADMAAVLDACGARKAVIGGHSLGGYMSLAFYLSHPDRVRALMLFNTGPGYKNDEARIAWNRMAEKQAGAFARKGLAAVGHSEEMQLGTHVTALGLEHAARGMLAQSDARVMDGLTTIHAPSLVLVGEKDRGYLAAADHMAAKIPKSRKVILADAGHAANLHQPIAFNAAVEEFLKGLPAAPDQ
ncbi:MAG: alpha/beta fold hydrolase [Pseudomonadota bacterium]|nr:alpha/beta hydrolase [Alphaproteobacteria bacterium]